MVDALLDKFITTGENNDIYDWVTTIFGEEYGNHSYNNLITPSDTIDILLFDIDDDNSTNGGVVGYYWARDQFLPSTETTSSERVLFALDSVLTATPEGQNPWSENARWFQEVISTLAHEFQHMINFYQRNVIMGQNDEAWYNEMFSMVAEDLVANKILVNGPRGVDYATADAGVVENQFGRLPYFIFYPDRSLTYWASNNDVLYDYAASYAFGAFLTRFTGDPGFFYDLYQRNATGLSAVRAQIQVAEDLDSLPSTTEVLARWGAALLLSDTTTAVEPGNYNTGGFFSGSINGSSYSVGSINIFNYRFSDGGEITQDGPLVYSGGTANPYGGFEPTSNTYYELGTDLTGTQKVTISGMPAGVSVTVVLK
jgi:hypothetical protein